MRTVTVDEWIDAYVAEHPEAEGDYNCLVGQTVVGTIRGCEVCAVVVPSPNEASWNYGLDLRGVGIDVWPHDPAVFIPSDRDHDTMRVAIP